jgi:hypothetical protein
MLHRINDFLKIYQKQLVIGYWLLVVGYWLLVISYWLLVIAEYKFILHINYKIYYILLFLIFLIFGTSLTCADRLLNEKNIAETPSSIFISLTGLHALFFIILYLNFSSGLPGWIIVHTYLAIFYIYTISTLPLLIGLTIFNLYKKYYYITLLNIPITASIVINTYYILIYGEITMEYWNTGYSIWSLYSMCTQIALYGLFYLAMIIFTLKRKHIDRFSRKLE